MLTGGPEKHWDVLINAERRRIEVQRRKEVRARRSELGKEPNSEEEEAELMSAAQALVQASLKRGPKRKSKANRADTPIIQADDQGEGPSNSGQDNGQDQAYQQYDVQNSSHDTTLSSQPQLDRSHTAMHPALQTSYAFNAAQSPNQEFDIPVADQ